MTSSLVGSEMCIRDSSNPSNVQDSGPNSIVALVRGSRCTAKCASPSWKSCLLYTSDAADDM
eukprot:793822-Prorocentrum_lima.AAC.1